MAVAILVSAQEALSAPLTAGEIAQIETELGITLSQAEKDGIAAIAKPDGPLPQWRIDAEARIAQHRMADLTVEVVDPAGAPVMGAQVDVKLKDSAFRFGGVMSVKDFNDANGNLQGITTGRYRELFLKLFNAGGLDNGLKQKQRTGNEAYLPGFFSWAQQNELPVRGHLLIWPGGTHMTPAVTAKVEELETLWDDVYLWKTYGNVASTDTVATVDALAGDLVVVMVSSNVGTEPLEPAVTFGGSATLSTAQFDRIHGNGPSVAWWHATVQTDGTVAADFTKGATYMSAAVYHLRPDGGAISLLDSDQSSAAGVSGVTNSYSFAGSSSGVLLEGVSTYASSTDPQSAEWVLPNNKRKVAHSYFTGVTSVDSTWTHTGTGNTASYGLAFANAQVVGEAAAKLAAPVLEQQLKDIIETEMTEWASLWPVHEWDVINEVRTNHRIQDLIGWDQMAEWFKIGESHAALPDCQFLLNEYGVLSAAPAATHPTEFLDRRDAMMGHLDLLQADAAPLDRIGFQSRITRGHLDPQEVYNRLEDFGTTYGLEMVATEHEVRENAGYSFFPDEAERAQITEEMLTAYFSHPLVSGFYNWTYMKAEDYAMCGYDGSLKLNGLVWYYLHRIRYVTDEQLTTDVAGACSLSAFKGSLDVSVSAGSAQQATALMLAGDGSQQIVLSAEDSDGDILPDAWETLYGLNPLVPETIPDPDGDGWVSILEFATGIDPTDPDGGQPLLVSSETGSDLMDVRFRERGDLNLAGLTVQLEYSTDLTNWDPVDPDDVSVLGLTLVGSSEQSVSDGYGQIVEHMYSFEIPASTSFFRVKVMSF